MFFRGATGWPPAEGGSLQGWTGGLTDRARGGDPTPDAWQLNLVDFFGSKMDPRWICWACWLGLFSEFEGIIWDNPWLINDGYNGWNMFIMVKNGWLGPHPLVDSHITMERSTLFLWENSLFLWPFLSLNMGSYWTEFGVIRMVGWWWL